MKQPVKGLEQDDEGYWVAVLECDHRQHVRHKPPFIERSWVTTDAGRLSIIGALLDCVLCTEGESQSRQ